MRKSTSKSQSFGVWEKELSRQRKQDIGKLQAEKMAGFLWTPKEISCNKAIFMTEMNGKIE